jgi:UPF0755 protein
MNKYRVKNRTRQQRLKTFLIIIAVVIILLIGITIIVRRIYDENIQPLSHSQRTQIIVVSDGMSSQQIANLLKKDNIIRSSWAFEWYVRSQTLRGDLQAGTYSLSPSQSVSDIINVLTEGKVTIRLITILPDRRLDQIQSDLINDGFSPASVAQALQPAQYSFLPVLAFKPSSANLEGLLYPDSFQKDSNTTPEQIIQESLTEMGQHLTPSLQAAFASEGLSTYQGIILASIVQQEVIGSSDQAQAAQVFLKRLSTGMPLGSDQTAFYGAIIAGQSPSVSYDSPYNTLLHTGLPPTPLSNVNAQALNAMAHPANTDWLYFVTGDNGTTYFEQTAQEHQNDINQYCHIKCAQDSQ